MTSGAATDPACADEGGMSVGVDRFAVGMALKKNKGRKHISDRLVQLATEEGIDIKILDEFAPLSQQGPLHAILQKIRRREWEEELAQYVEQHPDVWVGDLPAATYPLRNRGSMLTPFAGPGWMVQAPAGAAGRQRIRCSVPLHATLPAGQSLEAATAQLAAAGIAFPMLAKSLWADGREGSHAMAVVHSQEGLRQLIERQAGEALAPPVLLQQYVEHGTCLFKVYVLGQQSVMVTRPSLHLPPYPETWASEPPPPPAAAAEQRVPGAVPARGNGAAAAEAGLCESMAEVCVVEPGTHTELEQVERVSAYPRSRSWGKGDLAPKGHGVPAPPEWLWRQVASRIRTEFGLSLFNFDLIVALAPPPHQRGLLQQQGEEGRPGGGAAGAVEEGEGQVHLIDINYFPGYEKLPGYEQLMVAFLCELRQRRRGQGAAVGVAGS